MFSIANILLIPHPPSVTAEVVSTYICQNGTRIGGTKCALFHLLLIA